MSTAQSERSGLTAALYHRHAVWVPILLVLADRAITIAYWSMEANPLVTELGLSNWLLLTVGLVTAYPICWYVLDARRVGLMYWFLWLFTGLQALAVGTNAGVVLGWL